MHMFSLLKVNDFFSNAQSSKIRWYLYF